MKDTYGKLRETWVTRDLMTLIKKKKEANVRPDQSLCTDTLICLTELILTLHNFSFNSSHFLQTKGVAIGTRMGPSYACPFVGYVEQSLFDSYTGPIPHLFLRCIDD
eukprot:g21511.t1